MEVICLEEAAFYSLIDKVVMHIKEQQLREDLWISGEEAMQKLRIKSKTSLQKLRDEGKIRFSQPEKKHIVYDLNSNIEYELLTFDHN